MRDATGLPRIRKVPPPPLRLLGQEGVGREGPRVPRDRRLHARLGHHRLRLGDLPPDRPPPVHAPQRPLFEARVRQTLRREADDRREEQVTPFHFHWNKMEDIINRGGGNLLIQLYNSTPTASSHRRRSGVHGRPELRGGGRRHPPGDPGREHHPSRRASTTSSGAKRAAAPSSSARYRRSTTTPSTTASRTRSAGFPRSRRTPNPSTSSVTSTRG